jgi:hypothetical protein
VAALNQDLAPFADEQFRYESRIANVTSVAMKHLRHLLKQIADRAAY